MGLQRVRHDWATLTISLSIMFSNVCVYCQKCQDLLLSYGWIIFIYYAYIVFLYIMFSLSIYPSMNRLFLLMAIVSNAAMNMTVQITLWGLTFNSFKCILRSGVARSYSSSISNFLKKFHTVFHSDYTIYLLCNNVQGLRFLNILGKEYLLFSFFPFLSFLDNS